MSGISWWRSWHGAPMDHKWAVISARSGVKPGIVSAIAWALLDYASQQDDRGSIEGFDVEEYAVFSGFSESEVLAVISAMTDKGIIHEGRFANWEERQPEYEDGIERVRRWRKRKQAEGKDEKSEMEDNRKSETESQQNATQTNMQEDNEGVTDCYAVLRDVTQSYIDKDKDKELTAISNEIAAMDARQQAPPGENLGSKKHKSSKDERSDHPAIQAIRTVMGRYPPKTVYNRVIAELGDTPDIARLTSVVEEWSLRGYNMQNFLGILRWYREGIDADTRKSGGRNGRNHDGREAGAESRRYYDPQPTEADLRSAERIAERQRRKREQAGGV